MYQFDNEPTELIINNIIYDDEIIGNKPTLNYFVNELTDGLSDQEFNEDQANTISLVSKESPLLKVKRDPRLLIRI